MTGNELMETLKCTALVVECIAGKRVQDMEMAALVDAAKGP